MPRAANANATQESLRHAVVIVVVNVLEFVGCALSNRVHDKNGIRPQQRCRQPRLQLS